MSRYRVTAISWINGEVKRAPGRTPPVNDTLLAATAIEHDLCLITRNVRDVQATGALVLDPWRARGPYIMRPE